MSYTDSPVIDLSFFADPMIGFSLICLSILFGLYFAIITLLANWLTFDVRFTPTWIAVLIGQMGLAGLLPRFIIEERLGRIHPIVWIALATILLSISCFYTATFNEEINFGRIIFSRIVAGFGLALFLPPIFQLLQSECPPHRWISLFEIFQTVRNIACALGVSIFMIIWQRRIVFYHERLNETISHQSNAGAVYFNTYQTLHVPGSNTERLNELLDRQASSLALDDVFYVMGWILLGLLALEIFVLSFYSSLLQLGQKWQLRAGKRIL